MCAFCKGDHPMVRTIITPGGYREWAIVVDGATKAVGLNFCPYCGRGLPELPVWRCDLFASPDNHWIVSASASGADHHARFYGNGAKAAAEAYCAWLNSQEGV